MLNFFKKNKKSEEVKNKLSLKDRLFKSKKKLADTENQAKIEELKAIEAEEKRLKDGLKAKDEAHKEAEKLAIKAEEEKVKKAEEAEILAKEAAKEAEEKLKLEEKQRKAEEEKVKKAEEAEILAKEAAKEAEEVKKKPSLKERLFKSKQKLGDGLTSLIIGKKKIDDDLIEELEILLISSDIGIQTTDKVIESVRQKASRKELKNEDSLYQLIKVELESLLIAESHLEPSPEIPFVILVVGINGAGKTTTIGKLAKLFQGEGKTVMLAAGDTFRAAAVEQLQVWGERNDIPVIAQKTGADAASVVYDAYQSAIAKKIDILIADTAGRLHTQDNLMQELEKIKRVLKKHNEDAPHETLLVIDGGSGQNAVQQANEFHKSISLSGLAITKLDGTAKGGVLFSISDSLKLPIRFIGVGEGIEDLKPFNAKDFVDALFD